MPAKNVQHRCGSSAVMAICMAPCFAFRMTSILNIPPYRRANRDKKKTQKKKKKAETLEIA